MQLILAFFVILFQYFVVEVFEFMFLAGGPPAQPPKSNPTPASQPSKPAPTPAPATPTSVPSSTSTMSSQDSSQNGAPGPRSYRPLVKDYLNRDGDDCGFDLAKVKTEPGLKKGSREPEKTAFSDLPRGFMASRAPKPAPPPLTKGKTRIKVLSFFCFNHHFLHFQIHVLPKTKPPTVEWQRSA